MDASFLFRPCSRHRMHGLRPEALRRTTKIFPFARDQHLTHRTSSPPFCRTMEILWKFSNNKESLLFNTR